MDERETERFKIIQETRKEFEKAQLKQNKEVNQMFELAQKRTQAEIEDFAGGLFSGNTESGITATYQAADNTVDLVVASQTD